MVGTAQARLCPPSYEGFGVKQPDRGLDVIFCIRWSGGARSHA